MLWNLEGNGNGVGHSGLGIQRADKPSSPLPRNLPPAQNLISSMNPQYGNVNELVLSAILDDGNWEVEL